MILLKDIANHVGVSISLVSKVLNKNMGTTGISQETIERVQKAAKELGYRKNTSAASLKNGRHNGFGVFIHHIGLPGSEIMEQMVRGISAEGWKKRQRLTLAFYESDKDAVELYDSAHPNSMDGVILAGLAHPNLLEQIEDIQRTKLPIVTLYDTPIKDDIVNVGMCQKEVGRVATEYLIKCGARHIAHIKTNSERFEGYKQALAAANIAFDPELVYTTPNSDDFGHMAGDNAVDYWIENKITFDAVFAQSDQEAMGCIRRLSALNIRVPEDVQIVGVDNSPYCDFVRVPITSISQCFYERGEKATQMLLDMVEKKPVESASFEPQVIVRASTKAL